MTEPAAARPSSTVVMARPGRGEPEVFMVRRHEASSFGAAWAFPGGVLDAEDAAVNDYCTGVTERAANARLGVRDGGLAYFSAAIRELFEETGVLLAGVDDVDEDLGRVRDGLNSGADNWLDFVTRNALELHCDSLYYISHWVTPELLPRRYSTRFFVAALPDGQVASHCGGELTASRWSTAHDMLSAGRAGEVELHFPTVKTLESIARHKTFDALVDWASSCAGWGVTSMLPVIIMRDGKRDVVLPGDKDYPGTTA